MDRVFSADEIISIKEKATETIKPKEEKKKTEKV
jgi:hypothetical protein